MSYVTYLYNYNTLPYIYIYIWLNILFRNEVEWQQDFRRWPNIDEYPYNLKDSAKKGKTKFGPHQPKETLCQQTNGIKLLGYGIVTVLRISYLTMLNRGVFMGEWGID